MSTIKRILVALSGTPFTESAIRHAVDLAERHGAEVTGVTDIDLAKVANVGPVPMGAGAAAHDLVEHRLKLAEEHVEASIRKFEAACAEAGVVGRVARESGDPFEKLTALSRYHDLVVAGLRGLFEYGVVREPDDLLTRVAAKGVRPMLAVAKAYREVRRVLVAYDGSMEASKSQRRFMQMGLWPDIKLGIVCFDDKDDGERLLADAAEYCALWGHEPQTHLEDGSPRDRLLPFAGEWKADLLVMGTTSRLRLLQHLLGDTVLHCLREAEIPLFVTR